MSPLGVRGVGTFEDLFPVREAIERSRIRSPKYFGQNEVSTSLDLCVPQTQERSRPTRTGRDKQTVSTAGCGRCRARRSGSADSQPGCQMMVVMR